ncbi:MAG TPA: hypothetical protein VGZ32_04545 [Actinocrinis sp.]|uniref:hypothetical protein n=1 Tax=Actinocrinis sp. TaxID=1920516 RepID=UPI002DDD5732|nr:hypothetical protein [Actinocrinis sp.]HEV3169580.1 hypothetical protein [Actinocrinis sp.]
MTHEPMTVSVLAPADVPQEAWEAEWSTHALAVHPRRVREMVRTPSWRHWMAVACEGGQVIGLMPMSQIVGDRFPVQLFDPRLRAPGLATAAKAEEYLLIGGHFDLASGCSVLPELSASRAADVRRALARAGFDHARREGLDGIALYVPDAERAAWDDPQAPYTCEQVSEFNAIELAEPGWDGYIAGLKSSRRSVVVRDVRALEQQGLRAELVDPATILAEAAPLIIDVKANHGQDEHPQLVEYRLERWIGQGAGVALAFALRDAHGSLLAAAFGRRCGRVIEMYEIGLCNGIPARTLAYAEVLIYAPLRHAADTGCTVLRLGCESGHPKQLRGAAVSPVWAVGLPS